MEITALLGRGTHFEGTFCFEGRVRIDGSFKGEILGDDTLVVGEGAVVHATITVGTLIVRGGEVRGNVKATVGVELYAPSKLHGDIDAPSVFMDRGTTFVGACRMTPLPPVVTEASTQGETEKTAPSETAVVAESAPSQKPATEKGAKSADKPKESKERASGAHLPS